MWHQKVVAIWSLLKASKKCVKIGKRVIRYFFTAFSSRVKYLRSWGHLKKYKIIVYYCIRPIGVSYYMESTKFTSEMKTIEAQDCSQYASKASKTLSGVSRCPPWKNWCSILGLCLNTSSRIKIQPSPISYLPSQRWRVGYCPGEANCISHIYLLS